MYNSRIVQFISSKLNLAGNPLPEGGCQSRLNLLVSELKTDYFNRFEWVRSDHHRASLKQGRTYRTMTSSSKVSEQASAEYILKIISWFGNGVEIGCACLAESGAMFTSSITLHNYVRGFMWKDGFHWWYHRTSVCLHPFFPFFCFAQYGVLMSTQTNFFRSFCTGHGKHGGSFNEKSNFEAPDLYQRR